MRATIALLALLPLASGEDSQCACPPGCMCRSGQCWIIGSNPNTPCHWQAEGSGLYDLLYGFVSNTFKFSGDKSGTEVLRGTRTVSQTAGIEVGEEKKMEIEGAEAAAKLGDPNNFIHEMGSKSYRCGTEGYDKTRKSMQEKFENACSKEKCSANEKAIVIAMASQESDKMDKTDTSKGSSGGSSNWSPFNMNMDALSYLGCDSSCAKSLGQSASKYNIDKAVHYLVKGIRGETKIGGTCDFMNFQRDGSTGWKACLHKSCKCDCGSKGCKAYKDAIADTAHQILDNKDFTGGKRYCEKVPHIR